MRGQADGTLWKIECAVPKTPSDADLGGDVAKPRIGREERNRKVRQLFGTKAGAFTWCSAMWAAGAPTMNWLLTPCLCFCGFDTAVNNAATVGPIKPLAEVNLKEWHGTLATNLTSAFVASLSKIPAVLERGGGSMIFTSSFVDASVGLPGMAQPTQRPRPD
jgi:NAD(P)-dependent dehydrogenase (short-subunit alcohol dehydrogenase family)